MSRLADPKILMSLKNLQLAAKTTIDGFVAGIHYSSAKGAGMEFSQYRSYGAGDDLRLLDWKMFARSDRYYIRETQIENNLSVKILIDASASMNHDDDGITKIEYARYLAASLAYLSLQQSDAVGLYTLQGGKLFSLPSRKDSQHFSRIAHDLEGIQPSGFFTQPVHYKNLFGNAKKELLVLITDYYQQDGEITKLLQSLAVYKHEIIVFHLLGNNEMTPQFAGYTTLEDWETGQTIEIDNTTFTNQYRNRLQDYLASVKSELLTLGIWYELINMSNPIDTALQQFLHRRNKIRG